MVPLRYTLSPLLTGPFTVRTLQRGTVLLVGSIVTVLLTVTELPGVYTSLVPTLEVVHITGVSTLQKKYNVKEFSHDFSEL